METHKFGFVTIVGKPNVGKSTLLNSIIGYKIAIATPKKNTTRNQIRGIYNDDNSQIVFIDTPGFLETKNRLDEKMHKSISESLVGVEVILYLLPFWKQLDNNYLQTINFFANIHSKKYLVLTKIDKAKNKEEVMKYVSTLEHKELFDKIIPTSALKTLNIKHLIEEIKLDLPKDALFYYDRDQIHENSDEFYISEIIREKLLLNFNEEIPYNVFVHVESIENKKEVISIFAEIILDRESHKKIIIGKDGAKLKKIGIEARKELENYFNKKIYLELFVKVRRDWKNKESILNEI